MGEAALEIITTRKPEIDLSGDGRPDFTREYDSQGRIRRFRIDGDYDGRPDYEEERDGFRIGSRQDQNLDGRFDRWLSLWLDDAGGDYSRQEWIDSDHDGTVDLWITEESSFDGESVLREESRDTDRDGQPDRFEKTARPRWLSNEIQPEVDAISGAGPLAGPGSSTPPGLTPTEMTRLTSGCGMPSWVSPASVVARLIPDLRRVVRGVHRRMPPTADWRRTPYGPQIDLSSCGSQVALIQTAVRRSTHVGLECLADLNRALMCRYAVFLAERLPEIRCRPETSFANAEEELPDVPHAGTSGTDACAIGAAPGREIWLSRSAFTPACGSLEGVIFHEFLHNIGVGTMGPHSHLNPLDGVYGCERACFPAGGLPIPPPEPACRAVR